MGPQNNSNEVLDRKRCTRNCGYYTSQLQGQVEILKNSRKFKSRGIYENEDFCKKTI